MNVFKLRILCYGECWRSFMKAVSFSILYGFFEDLKMKRLQAVYWETQRTEEHWFEIIMFAYILYSVRSVSYYNNISSVSCLHDTSDAEITAASKECWFSYLRAFFFVSSSSKISQNFVAPILKLTLSSTIKCSRVFSTNSFHASEPPRVAPTAPVSNTAPTVPRDDPRRVCLRARWWREWYHRSEWERPAA